MNKTIILTVILSAICTQQQAQEVFTLEKCKELALQNNLKVQNAELAVAAAEQSKKEAFTKYFPEVSATGFGVAFTDPLMTQEVSTGQPAPNDRTEVEMFNNGIIGSIMATQPLYAGGQIINGNRLAKTGVEVSRLQEQMSKDEALFATERYFWQLVSLKEKIRTIIEAGNTLARVQNDVKAAVEAGLTNRNDFTRVELEQNRLAANRLKLENGIRILKMAFAQHIGVAADSFDVLQPDFTGIIMSDTHINDTVALHNRPEYQLLDKSVEVAKLQVKMEVGKHLPTVAIGGGYNYSNFDPGKRTEMEKNMGLAYITVSVPISGWWGGSYSIRKKKIELQAAVNTRNETANLLLLQMQKLACELDEEFKQVLLAQKSISVAEENVRLNQNTYNAGVSILSDLLESQSLLQQSRDQYTEAATGYFIKLAEYKQATGSML